MLPLPMAVALHLLLQVQLLPPFLATLAPVSAQPISQSMPGVLTGEVGMSSVKPTLSVVARPNVIVELHRICPLSSMMAQSGTASGKPQVCAGLPPTATAVVCTFSESTPMNGANQVGTASVGAVTCTAFTRYEGMPPP